MTTSGAAAPRPKASRKKPALNNARFRRRAEKVFREAGPLGTALLKQIEAAVDEEENET